jgi:hypothetical protein
MFILDDLNSEYHKIYNKYKEDYQARTAHYNIDDDLQFEHDYVLHNWSDDILNKLKDLLKKDIERCNKENVFFRGCNFSNYEFNYKTRLNKYLKDFDDSSEIDFILEELNYYQISLIYQDDSLDASSKLSLINFDNKDYLSFVIDAISFKQFKMSVTKVISFLNNKLNAPLLNTKYFFEKDSYYDCKFTEFQDWVTNILNTVDPVDWDNAFSNSNIFIYYKEQIDILNNILKEETTRCNKENVYFRGCSFKNYQHNYNSNLDSFYIECPDGDENEFVNREINFYEKLKNDIDKINEDFFSHLNIYISDEYIYRVIKAHGIDNFLLSTNKILVFLIEKKNYLKGDDSNKKLSENNNEESTINKYPRIFKNDFAFSIFLGLNKEFGNTIEILANYSYVFHKMTYEDLIHFDLQQKTYIDMLSDFDISIDRIKPKAEIGKIALRDSIYDKIKQNT